MKNYTEQIEAKIWEFPDTPEMEYDYKKIGAFLNADFRTFGESLSSIIDKKAGEKIDNPIEHIKLACKMAEINESEIASRNTFKSWFTGGPRPKKSESSRKSMFALAFALQLNVEETEELFHKAYLDRSFNHRDYKELIYYYCIGRGYSYSYAAKLINSVSFDGSTNSDATIYTTNIKSDIQVINEDSALLEYIENHKHNLSLNNKRAFELLEYYKEKAFTYISRTSRMHGNSSNALYEAITGQIINSKSGTRTIKFKNGSVPNEIKINFPQVKNLTEETQSYEELRKTLILVYSFCYWNELTSSTEEIYDVFDDYIAKINLVLLEANMPLLYLGNPYDWMFAYCSYTTDPLNVFQDIMQEVLTNKK